MRVLMIFLHRYLSPFAAGCFMAGMTVVSSGPAAMLLLLGAAMSGFAALPAGGRMIERLSGVTP